MSGANRIPGKGRLTPARTARFTFDGKSYTALEGGHRRFGADRQRRASCRPLLSSTTARAASFLPVRKSRMR